MVFEFADRQLPDPRLPEGFHFVPWQPEHLGRHAAAKYASFHGEIDSRVFPCLADENECLLLMEEIANQKSFLPAATWLVTQITESGPVDCGTIQGLANSTDAGSVQNVGIIKMFRGQGVGRALVLKLLHGFRDHGVRRVYLEATAENVPAVELYRSIGFRLIRTTFKQIPEEAAANWPE